MPEDFNKNISDHANGCIEIELVPTKWFKFKKTMQAIGRYLLNQWIGIVGIILAIISLCRD